MSERLIVALDGHDGSGKTTLAYALAERLGGTMVARNCSTPARGKISMSYCASAPPRWMPVSVPPAMPHLCWIAHG